MISRKVLLTGSSAVGKTALLDRFVYNAFSERYPYTVGVKVDKKEISVHGQDIALVIWNISGEVSREKVPRTYFLGASAVLYVFDLSRPESLKNMEADLRVIRKTLPGCLLRIVGNKTDLVGAAEILAFKQQVPEARLFTSAKTGENVDGLFHGLGAELLKKGETG